jgi:hypothetical protein
MTTREAAEIIGAECFGVSKLSCNGSGPLPPLHYECDVTVDIDKIESIIARCVEAATKAERERCARVAEAHDHGHNRSTCKLIAAAIREGEGEG